MTLTRASLLASTLLFLAQTAPPGAAAQQQPGGPPTYPSLHRDERRGPGGQGMGIVPPGAWWRNSDTIKLLNLSADQQTRLDAIFRESRIQLIQMHASLEEEQLKLEPLLNANPVDQARALDEISQIADLRANLEKADAKMLLGLRGVLTAEQWTKLQADMRSHRPEGAGGSHMHRDHNGPSSFGPPNPPAPPVSPGAFNEAVPPPPTAPAQPATE